MIFTGIFYCKGGLYEQEIHSPPERTALALTASHFISLWKGGSTLQEEIESKTVTLAITTTKLTARVLKEAMSKYLAYKKQKRHDKKLAGPVKPTGKQTVKQLIGQNQGVSNIEVTDSNIKSFERVARKYGVDYAIKKDRSGEVPKYLVFFKARDTDALTAAFTEFTAKQVQQKDKPSIIAQIRSLAEHIRAISKDRVKNKEKGREL